MQVHNRFIGISMLALQLSSSVIVNKDWYLDIRMEFVGFYGIIEKLNMTLFIEMMRILS